VHTSSHLQNWPYSHNMSKVSTDIPLLCKEAVERFPGVIFSKTAPENLDEVDYETDFCYYYFSAGLENKCSLQRAIMLTGETNATRDFGADAKQYFVDDTEVMTKFTNGNAKCFCEPWNPPGVVGNVRFVYTLKTALNCGDKSFMLGTFDLVDDYMTGAESTMTVALDARAALPPLHDQEKFNVPPIPDLWFQQAFSQLPLGRDRFLFAHYFCSYS
jgi:hypothetical protein